MNGMRLSKYLFYLYRSIWVRNIFGVDKFESTFPDWTAFCDRYSDVWSSLCFARPSPVSDDRYRVIKGRPLCI